MISVLLGIAIFCLEIVFQIYLKYSFNIFTTSFVIKILLSVNCGHPKFLPFNLTSILPRVKRLNRRVLPLTYWVCFCLQLFEGANPVRMGMNNALFIASVLPSTPDLPVGCRMWRLRGCGQVWEERFLTPHAPTHLQGTGPSRSQPCRLLMLWLQASIPILFPILMLKFCRHIFRIHLFRIHVPWNNLEFNCIHFRSHWYHLGKSLLHRLTKPLLQTAWNVPG